MGIRIITDSTTEYSLKKAKEKNIIVAPLKINFGKQEYYDQIDITNQDFYEKMKNEKELPRTSQVNPDEFKVLFEQAKENGDDVVGIFISSNLSGTYQSAKIAKVLVDYENIHIVDSGLASIATQILVDEAVNLRSEGKSAKEIIDNIESMKEKIELNILVDDLTNLKKGGRLSSTSATIASVLLVKPIVKLQDGKLVMADKAKGRKNGIKKLIENYKNNCENKNVCLYVGHTNCEEYLNEFKESIKNEFPNIKFVETYIGAVVGTHLGQGCIAIAFYKN